MKAISDNTKIVEIKTKTNYRGLNGKLLKVHENFSNFVSCKVWADEYQKFIIVDFGKSEIVSEYSNKNEIPPFIYN